MNNQSQQSAKATSIAYWATTAVVLLIMLPGGVIDAMRTPDALQVMTSLGYPEYFSILLGVAKILGSLAIVVPVSRTLREWAYAGFTFDVISAIVSISVRGPVNWMMIVPVFALVMVQANYWLWRKRLEHDALRTGRFESSASPMLASRV